HRAPAIPAAGRRVPVALLALVAFLFAIALIPDEAVLRTKVVWGLGLMLLAVSVALAEQAARGELRWQWTGFLAAAWLPGLLALAWLLRTEGLSRALAQDEIKRLLCVPIVAWTVSSCLPTPSSRRLFLAALLLSVIPVAGYAVAQKLAGVLD